MIRPTFNIKWLLAVTILFIVIGYTLISAIKPVIILQNNTDKTIYVSIIQLVNRSTEPTDEEVAQFKRVRVIEPNKELNIPIYLKTLTTEDNMVINMSWRIGSRVTIEAKTGGNRLYIHPTEGVCHAKIIINEESSQVLLDKGGFCYKKLSTKNNANTRL